MAYVFDPNLSDEENQRRAAAGEEAARPGSGEITGGGQPAGAQPPGTPTSSGSFTNIQRYLSENQPQATGLAQRVAGQVDQAGQAAKSAAEGVVQTADQQIEANRVPFQQDLVDQAAKDPSSVASDATKKADFTKERDASYAGPAGLEDVAGFQDAQAKVKSAQDKIGMAGTEAGRTQLLTDISPAGAGKGKLALNNLLISGSPEAGDIVAGAGKPYANLGDYLSSSSAAERQKAVDAANEAATTKQKVQDRFSGPSGVVPTMAADLAGRLSSTRTSAQQRADAVKTALQGMDLSDQDLADLGISREDFSGIKGYGDITGGQAKIDPLAFLTTQSPDNAFTLGNVATSEDYARQKALEDLMGGTATTGLNDSDAAMAGTAPKSLTAFDTPGATGAAKSSFQTFMEQKTPALLQVSTGSVGAGSSLHDISNLSIPEALSQLGAIDSVANLNYGTPAQKVEAAKMFNTPIFQAFYKAAKDAWANRANIPQSENVLIKHLPPEIAAMLR